MRKKTKILLIGLLLGGFVLSSCIFDPNNPIFSFPTSSTTDDTSTITTDDTTSTTTDDTSTVTTDDTTSSSSDDTTSTTTDDTSSVTTDDITSSITDDSTSSTTDEPNYDNYYRSEIVDPYFNYQDLLKADDLNSIPTPRTDLNILVIPVEFSDYRFTTKKINDLKTVFNGTAAQTNYWESVASFYQKSSFNNVNINFTVADVYDSGHTARSASNLTAWYTYYFSTVLLRNAVDNYKLKKSTKPFDKDGDGFIDAVWLIYSCPNAGESPSIANISEDYWAYVYWDYLQDPSTNSPNASVYAWASYDFMYYNGNTSKLDAHTYIHETGHLFGLDDYYNYDTNSSDGPMGGLDMMDHNVIDHNVWSKMSLGWTQPYVVTGDAIITINPSQVNGDSILLANNWNGTSFDEFLMLELYTPTGLNELDSSTRYLEVYPRGFTIPGIRMYHVDSRLGLFSPYGNFVQYGHPIRDNLITSNGSYFGVAHSNTPSYSQNNNRLLHMIQAGKKNTYKSGWTGTNADLFQAGNIFTMEDYSVFFRSKKLNNGENLNYQIEFLSVTSSEATIKFTKI